MKKLSEVKHYNLDGINYSSHQFNEYRQRVRIILNQSNSIGVNLEIYMDRELGKDETNEFLNKIFLNKKDILGFNIERIYTKHQDEMTSQFIEEFFGENMKSRKLSTIPTKSVYGID